MQLAACHLEHSLLEPSLACDHQVQASPEGEEKGGRRGRGREGEGREKERKEGEGRGGALRGVALRCQTFDKTSNTAK